MGISIKTKGKKMNEEKMNEETMNEQEMFETLQNLQGLNAVNGLIYVEIIEPEIKETLVKLPQQKQKHREFEICSVLCAPMDLDFMMDVGDTIVVRGHMIDSFQYKGETVHFVPQSAVCGIDYNLDETTYDDDCGCGDSPEGDVE